MRRWTLAAVIGGLTVGTLALAQARRNGEPRRGQPQAQMQMGVPMPTEPQAFLERLHASNQREIRLSRLAQEQASSPAVREFAQRLVRDHTQADQRVMSFAQRKNMRLGEPRAINDMDRKLMDAQRATGDAMQGLQGRAFDHLYMADMLASHDFSLFRLQAAPQQFRDPEIGRLAQELQTTVGQHRDQAYRILGQISPTQAGVGGAGVGGAGTQQQPEEGMQQHR